MKHYEMLALVPGTLSDEETQAAQQNIRAILEKNGANVTKQDLWERRKLAYPIRRLRQGAYLLFTFDVEQANLNTLERAFTLDKTIVRHQIVTAHIKTAKELEEETRRRSAAREAKRVETEHTEGTKEVSPEELDEKLAQILTDDMVK